MNHENETAAAQGEPMTINSQATVREDPEDTIARLETRVRLIARGEEVALELCRERGAEIEGLSVSNRRAYGELLRTSAAFERARETFHIFPANPEPFFAMLEERHIHTMNHLGGILRWLEAVGLSAKALRKENPGLYPRIFTNDQLADVMECVAILLEGGADILKDGSQEVYPDPNRIFPDPANVKQSLEGLRADLIRRQTGIDPKPQGPVFYCPTCKRHVAPEDASPYYPDVPSYTGNDHYHNRERGGCGEKVEARNPTE